MATTSNILSTLGVGSGLDVASIVNSLMNSNSAPLAALQGKANGIQSELSEYGQISSSYSQLQTAITALQSPSAQNSLLGLSVNTSTAAVANASITGAASAASYALNVTSLAKGEQLVSAGGVADAMAALSTSPATLTIQLGKLSGGTLSGTPGTYAGSAFAPAGPSTTLAIPLGASLSNVRDAINTANAGIGATLVFDGSKYRLSLSSTSPGANSSISLEARGDPALSALLDQNPSGSQAFLETQAATDLAGTLNGIPIASSSNVLDKTVSGLSITAYGTGLATLSVAQNAGASAAAVNGFVAAWNGLSGIIKALTKYDAATKTAGPLLGDPLAGSAFQSLTSATFGYAAPSSAKLAYNTLASVGITVDSKGMASVDNAKLGSALKADPQALAKLLSTSQGNILGNANAYVANMIGGGGIGGRTASLNLQAAQNQKQQEAWTTRLASIRKSLTAQYTALDTSVAKMQSISSFLGNQIAQFNKA